MTHAARERYTQPGHDGQLGLGYRRDTPARYAALAAELRARDTVEDARAFALGVVARGDVPNWYQRKAELARVPLVINEPGGDVDD